MDAESEDDEDVNEIKVDAATGETSACDYSFKLRVPPSVNDARKALQDLQSLLKPPHNKTLAGSAILSPVLKERLTQVKNFLWLYTDTHDDGTTCPENPVGGHWSQAADRAARNTGKAQGVHLSRCLQSWAKAYIEDRTALPHCKQLQKYSHVDDEDFAAELKLHLQSIGKYVRAQDLVDYLSLPENQARLGMSKPICLRTAQQWMTRMGYRWMKEPHGQYSDGHEQEDVVRYHQDIFIPAWAHHQAHACKWKQDDLTVEDISTYSDPFGHRVVIWFHDESTFYANDRRRNRWVHKMESAVPQPKGEGASLMVADFTSADYGWLRSKDGRESARVLFRVGKAQDGYFTNENIVAHAAKAMEILEKNYPDEHHVLVFDNATTHLKHADDALSARKMPKCTSATWGVSITKKDDDGRPVIGTNGKPVKEKIWMKDAWLLNGDVQPLYFPDGHDKASYFKGMAQILVERGYTNAPNLPAECQEFKCPGGKSDCCCWRLMYTQADFANVESNLEATCHARGFDVIFLPKYHCELNFIEQCWGFAKRLYRKKDRSSSEAILECNVIESLDSVPLLSMRRFSVRSLRFIDAYAKGLNGTQAAWAIKKYCGHCMLPESIMKEFDDFHPSDSMTSI
ncbi:hypothetical protein BDR06DRAFT_899234 [Suillus hirtellus]|nr:hypothetical protein BDR06DRAFT_899234 [Suillus hirtellus]